MDYQELGDSKSRHGQIVHELGSQIVSGRLAPDSRIPQEKELIDKYGVSRPVVREAVRVLSAKGLVQSKPRTGTLVRPRAEWHLLDPDVMLWLIKSDASRDFFTSLVSLRRIMEPEMAAVAAAEANVHDIRAIEDAYNRLEEASSMEQRVQADTDFHSSVAAATHNELMVHLCKMLLLPISESIKISSQRPNDAQFTLPRHKAILTAIKDGDELAAKTASFVQLEDTASAVRSSR
ncbi:FadR/GntR family transcriptional regulator [Pseudarthrobacter sp. NPDC080039]|uniref:FadR/GntR family transcriptional regulator n=1 Tax=unclassified Pseudarthrobacter TaxID=2647000 RepID=UPI00344B66F6